MNDIMRAMERELDESELPFGIRCAGMHVEDAMARGMSEGAAWAFVLDRLGWDINERGELEMRRHSAFARRLARDVRDPFGDRPVFIRRGANLSADVALAQPVPVTPPTTTRDEADIVVELAHERMAKFGGTLVDNISAVSNERHRAARAAAAPVVTAASSAETRRRSADKARAEAFYASAQALFDGGKKWGDAFDAARKSDPEGYSAWDRVNKTNRDGSRG